LDTRSALLRAHRADARRPALWRALPLLVGVLLCVALLLGRPGSNPSDATVVALFTGVGLTGLGLVLVTPVLVHLLAAALLRLSPGAATTVAARRLQAQPVGVTRVVSALLIGLFLVTGARAVVVAFETTPQYLQAARQIEDGQRVALESRYGESARLARRIQQVAGVRRTVLLPRLTSGRGCTSGKGYCLDAIVATCARLHVVAPGLTGCVDGRPMWLEATSGTGDGLPAGPLDWYPTRGGEAIRAGGPVATVPAPTTAVHGGAWDQLSPVNAMMLLPPSDVDLHQLPARSSAVTLVLGAPGRGLLERLEAADATGSDGSFSSYDFADYDFDTGLRALVWAVAAVILSVGLLAFAVAGIDRAVARRREVVRLQLVGVPPGLLRRTQWLEAALPVGVGTLLAIGLGILAGATYLSFDDNHLAHVPWRQSLTLAAVSVVCAAGIAGLTVVAAGPRLRAELIRAE